MTSDWKNAGPRGIVVFANRWFALDRSQVVGAFGCCGLFRAVAKKQEYLKRLQSAIQELYRCSADYRRSVIVQEVVEGKTVWKGEVEIFWLTGHPSAKRCYAWGPKEEGGESREGVVAILEVPPVIGPSTAVRAAIAAGASRAA